MTKKTVQVAVRVRPLVTTEISKGCKDILEVFQGISQVKIRHSDKAFSYNYIFDVESKQSAVYETCVENMIENLFNGYNVTILAYGQTGSGKTHTMGTTYDGRGEKGIIPRAVADIFRMARDNFLYDVTVTVSFMEIYQETLYDLLSDKNRDQCILDIREDPTKGVLTPGLTEFPVSSEADVLEALLKGSRGRATGSTNMNAQSSRSHAIFTLNLSMQHKTDRNMKTAKFHLVDLAGSERPKKTGAVGTTFKEGVNINKGLLVLGNVISALGDDKLHNGYIPYRDSNLTRLLKDSLGGNSITLMIACVSPADYNLEETVSTLRYADRARKIQNKPVVNEDPKAAEINLLKKTIQDLKLQIVGQGGSAVCSQEVVQNLEGENRLLHAKIRELTLQLSSTLHDNTGLLEKLMILQNANDSLHRKICQLKAEYDITLTDINLSLQQMNQDGIKKNLQKLQEIQSQLVDIDSEQKKTESEIINHEESLDLHNSRSRLSTEESDVMSQDQENYTNKQVALNNELQNVNKNLALKERLAKQIMTNTQNLVDYHAMAENEAKILSLQAEKDELLQQLKSHGGPTAKISEQRRKRVQDLESQIQELNRKVHEQARLIKLKEKDMSKIKVLNNEILLMKQTRVKLIKKMREESEKFRTWKLQRERELAKLKQQDRKKQNQIIKMEVMHSKQQNVLKRKVEEAAALNKRLKDALSLRKATQDMKNSGKNEKMGHWIKQEFEVYLHLIEAEATLTGLLEDRATLQGQLDKFKENPDANSSQIIAIEEDIELRSAQIQDLQQKILDSDDDGKKSKLDNIQTMAEAKFGLKLIMEQAAEVKKQEVAVKAKLIDSQANYNEIQQQKNKLEKMLRQLDNKHADELSNLQKDYEEKVAVLLRQLRGVELLDASEELQQRCGIQSEKIEDLEKRNQQLVEELQNQKRESEELHEKLNIITQMATESENKTFVTPTKPEKPRKKLINKTGRLTYNVIGEGSNNDSSFEEPDDNTKDPDWKRTPLGKWLIRHRNRVQKNVSSDDTLEAKEGSLKRTSEGGCMCKGNCTRRCGCRKLSRPCSSGCKCPPDSCSNKNDSESENQDSNISEATEEKKRKLTRQNIFSQIETNDSSI